MSSKEHKKRTPGNLRLGLLTVSTSRTPASDESGQWLRKQADKEGHTVVSQAVIPDHQATIRTAVCRAINDHAPHILILTGGTGISPADVTIEAVQPLFTKELTAFGPAVAQLNLNAIDSAAIMSRATAGIVCRTVVFCLPGSLHACKLIARALIFPEAGHLAKHLQEG